MNRLLIRTLNKTIKLTNLNFTANKNLFKISNAQNLNKSFFSISCKNLDINNKKNKIVNEEENVEFGIGGRYVELDKRKSNNSDIKEEKISSKKHDPDAFGTLLSEKEEIEFQSNIGYSKPLSDTKTLNELDLEDKEQDLIENKYDKVLNHIRLSNQSDRDNNENYYAQRINEFAEKGQIKEALDFFFMQMIEKDRYKPTLYLYKVMMRHLANVGYTHMVFSLFKKLTSSKDDDWSLPSNQKKLHQIVTILFSACSKSAWPEYALRKTDSIRFYLKNRSITPTLLNYSAMISAYGRAGAIYEAFNTVDEMLVNNIKPDQHVFSNLLSACLSQKDYGFKYALMTWQMCLKFKKMPDLYMFNLLLTAVKKCNIDVDKSESQYKKFLPFTIYHNNKQKYIDDHNENKNLFPIGSIDHEEFKNDDIYDQLISNENNFKNENFDQTLLENDHKIKDVNNRIASSFTDEFSYEPQIVNEIIEVKKENVQLIDEIKIAAQALEKQIDKLEWWQDIKTNVDKDELMNSLKYIRQPELRQAIMEINSDEQLLIKVCDANKIESKLNELVSEGFDSVEHRLKMLGGAEGILDSMDKFKVNPDFKTFNNLIQIVPNTMENEKFLFERMKSYGLSPDIDFINFVMKRRIKRGKYSHADLAFKMIQENQLSPNIRTFGVLSFRCNNLKFLKDFLNDLKSIGFEMNESIMMTLYSKGIFMRDPEFLDCLFNFMIENKVKVNQRLFNRLTKDLERMKKTIIEMEKQNLKTMEHKEKMEYKGLTYFYERLKNQNENLIKNCKLQQQYHPYEKFGNKENPLFYSHMRESEKLGSAKTEM